MVTTDLHCMDKKNKNTETFVKNTLLMLLRKKGIHKDLETFG